MKWRRENSKEESSLLYVLLYVKHLYVEETFFFKYSTGEVVSFHARNIQESTKLKWLKGKNNKPAQGIYHAWDTRESLWIWWNGLIYKSDYFNFDWFGFVLISVAKLITNPKQNKRIDETPEEA